MDQKDVDALLITFVLMPESMFDISEAFAEIFSRHPDKPVFASYYGGTAREIAHIHEGFAALGVPCYPTPERAMFAFGPHGRLREVPRSDPQMIFGRENILSSSLIQFVAERNHPGIWGRSVK
ncbi:MAG: hypothetical protein MZV70_04685 [Desulfobacterales bacterium]|nr:hypothetical protein [Desulfobacterales bacterium]